MVTYKQIKQFAQNINTDDYNYEYIGIRVQIKSQKIGDIITHKSSVWHDGEELTEKFNGICVIDLDDAKNYPNYFGGYEGDYILLLGTNNLGDTYGQDYGELVFIDPVVLQVHKI